MPQDLIALLERFNRKERFFLVGDVLGNPCFKLSKEFRQRLGKEIGVSIPENAFAAMDYHLDWIAAAVMAHCKDYEEEDFRIPKGEGIKGKIEDVDFLVAFRSEKEARYEYHLIFIEAKGYGAWVGTQMNSKAKRLTVIFGDKCNKHPNINPHFRLMSPRPPQRLVTDSWPEWVKGRSGDSPYRWMELCLPKSPRLLVTSVENHFRIVSDGD